MSAHGYLKIQDVVAERTLHRMLRDAMDELKELDGRLEKGRDFRLVSGDPHLYQRENDLSHREELAARLTAVKKALDRLTRGKYGMCEQCGQRIQSERMRILPLTTLCIQCAKGEEASS